MKIIPIAPLFALAMACVAQGQPPTWPEKPVRIIVPLAPGGSVDIVARMIAEPLTEKFGQQFIVDNRPGAATTVGVAITARANPDGYTFIMMSPGYTSAAALYPKLPYDPVKDIAPVGLFAAGPMFLVVHPSVKAMNAKAFIELARVAPSALNYGSGGIGSSTHLASELFRQMTSINAMHVPYKGIGAAISDFLGGQLQFYIGPGAAMLPHVKAGRLRVLAITSEQRSPDFADLPALSETVPGYVAAFWYGLGGPSGTPRSIIAQLNQELARIGAQPEIQRRLRQNDLRATPSTPDSFARNIVREIAMWSKVVKAGKIKVE